MADELKVGQEVLVRGRIARVGVAMVKVNVSGQDVCIDRKDAAPSTPAAQPATDESGLRERRQRALELFMEYFCTNYPGPQTIIANPKWHAPKIFAAAEAAIKAAARSTVQEKEQP